MRRWHSDDCHKLSKPQLRTLTLYLRNRLRDGEPADRSKSPGSSDLGQRELVINFIRSRHLRGPQVTRSFSASRSQKQFSAAISSLPPTSRCSRTISSRVLSLSRLLIARANIISITMRADSLRRTAICIYLDDEAAHFRRFNQDAALRKEKMALEASGHKYLRARSASRALSFFSSVSGELRVIIYIILFQQFQYFIM
jgi:hypothetical protein